MNPRMFLRSTPVTAGFISFFAVAALAQEPTADGLYAGFTTSEGEFWCQLEFQKVPRTVANFVSLAEGSRPWVDFAQARIRQGPFYDGVTFHRVIKGFMNQSGSRNGLGTDGPGYQFKDEFDPALRHSQAGILSMANSGANSNGSQFFVTVEPTPWLDDKHTIFGGVVLGMDVVNRINQVPTNPANDRPLTAVTLQHVRILRIGAAALAFDPAKVAPALPAVAPVTSQLSLDQGTLLLMYPTQTNTLYHVFYGPDFHNWSAQTFTDSPINATGLLNQPYNFFLVLSGAYEP